MNKTVKKTRVIKPEEMNDVLFVRHLGTQPYNEIVLLSGKKIIASYSLNYWSMVFPSFVRIEKGVIVNPTFTSFIENHAIVHQKYTFSFSRRMKRIYKKSIQQNETTTYCTLNAQDIPTSQPLFA